MIEVETITVILIAVAACFAIFSASAIMTLNRIERLYTLQVHTMIEIIQAVAAEREGYYEEDDPTDEEEPPKPELATVIPFRSGSEGNPDDPA